MLKTIFTLFRMFWKKDKSVAPEKFYSLPLEAEEAAFMYVGYSGVLLRTPEATVAFDLADLLGENEIKALEGLDLLLYTHGHGDHYKKGTALRVFEATSPHVIAESSVARDLRGKIPDDYLTVAETGKTYSIRGFNVTAIEGVHRGPIILYLVKVDDKTVFHGGDSGYVPLEVFTADLAFLPTGDPSPTASPEYALKMTGDLNPQVVVAFHGSDDQNRELGKILEEKMPQTKLIIPEVFKPEKITLE
jgi:L-ascorbate metabolism protein UlaG (beta-lactamase superfamily)